MGCPLGFANEPYNFVYIVEISPKYEVCIQYCLYIIAYEVASIWFVVQYSFLSQFRRTEINP